MNLTYEIINNGTGYIIKKDGIPWIKQDSYIPYPGSTIEESVQNHINEILTSYQTEEQAQTDIEKLKSENEILRSALSELTTLLATHEERLATQEQAITESSILVAGGNE